MKADAERVCRKAQALSMLCETAFVACKTNLQGNKTDFSKCSLSICEMLHKFSFYFLSDRLSVRGVMDTSGNIVGKSDGIFMNQTIFVGTNAVNFNPENMDQTSFRALILLHERGHQSGVFQTDGGAANRQLNQAQTQRVLDACFN
jgi:hypothetical protein